MIRTFICCELPDPIIEQISALQQELGPFRWTRPQSIHITLSFLGEIEKTLLEPVEKCVKDAVINIAPFLLGVKGNGAFPNFRSPQVLWLGVEDATGNLARMQEKVVQELQTLGFQLEKRKFKPHLTMARLKSWQKDNPICQAFENYKVDFGNFFVKDIVVMKSELRPQGAIYTPICRINLKQK